MGDGHIEGGGSNLLHTMKIKKEIRFKFFMALSF